MKYIYIFFLIVCCFNAFSQKADLTVAILSAQDFEFNEAKLAIDKATKKIESGASLKPKRMSKYYYTKGDIYLNLYEDTWFSWEENPEKNNRPDFVFLDIASDAFLSDLLFSGVESKKSIVKFNRCARLYEEAAYKEYELKNYMLSEQKFEKAIKINTSEPVSKVDTLNMYNACLMAFLDENYSKSRIWASELVNLNSLDYRYHVKLIASYSEMGDLNGELEAIKNARILIPHSEDIILKEVNYYLASGNNMLLLESLDNAVQTDPDNSVLHFVLGSTYSSLGNLEKAKLSYQKSLSLDSNYVDAYNNLAAIYLEEANVFIEEKNNLSINASQKKYNNLESQIKKIRLQALPYLEKVLMLEPTDNRIAEILKQIYYQLEMDEESVQMRKLIALPDESKSSFVEIYFSK